MLIEIHTMHGCKLCEDLLAQFKASNISVKKIFDDPELDRPYPYIVVKYEYEEAPQLLRSLIWRDL